MIPGPIAVILLAIVVLWISPDPVSWQGVLRFTAAGLPAWVLLHVVLAKVLRAVARQRDPLNAKLLEVMAPHGGSAESWQKLMSDPIYQVAYVVSMMIKWAAVVAIGSFFI